MTQYYYRAKKSSTDVREGVIEAGSQDEVIAKVNEMGLIVVDIREQETAAQQPLPSHAVSNLPRHSAIGFNSQGVGRGVTRLYKQIARMLQSGIPLLQAVTLADEQVGNKALRRVLAQIKNQIAEGQSFSQSLSMYSEFFPSFDVALMEAGELVGHLDTTLNRLARHRESQEKVLARVRGALAYPLFVTAAGIAAVVFMLNFVLPKFNDFFLSLGQELPFLTRALIHTSQVMQKIGPFLLAGLALFLWVFRQSIQNSEKRIFWHRFYLGLPKIGSLITYSQLSRFARTMSLLLESGIPLLRALETTLPVLTNQSIKRELQRSVESLREGNTLSESLGHLKSIPAFVTQLVRSGEASGRLQESLNDIADWYEQELQEFVELATKFLEPLLILVVGIFLGLMVIAVLLPVFSMNAAIS